MALDRDSAGEAPGGSELPPTWTSSAKDFVTTSLGAGRVWATLGYGILNEVYWPSTGQPQVRDLGFIVAHPSGWTEVKRLNRYAISTPAPDVPLPTVVHEGEGWRLTLEIIADPDRDVLLIRHVLEGEGCRLHALLAPRLGQTGRDNRAEAGAALWASGVGAELCLASDAGFARTSAGRVGASDGWQDFSRNGAMTWDWAHAGPGNVALMGELSRPDGTLALGFAPSREGATTLARSALAAGFDRARTGALKGWSEWAAKVVFGPVEGRAAGRVPEALAAQARRSAAVMRAHEDRSFPGAIVASLSIPWGNARDDLGGYHLVWPRDAVNAGLGLLAMGQDDDARRMLSYLVAMQAPDGSWAQNFYPDGRPYWGGLQMDEVGLPVILATKLAEKGALLPGDGGEVGARRMVERAAAFILAAGPVTPQDRWEENRGLNGYTLAVLVAALCAAASWLEGPARALVLETADDWNARIEDWTAVAGTGLDHDHGLRGHYVRTVPRGDAEPGGQRVPVANTGGREVLAEDMVAWDFLALSRFGLRAPDWPLMQDTVALCEALLGIDTPRGRTYRRYNGDGYGERTDGGPFDGAGVGRGWPLLSGERGHFALQAGEDPIPYLDAMANMTGPGGMIPEQVWDGGPGTPPGRAGRPTGGAMPLVWAHSEFVRLADAVAEGRPVELLDCVQERWAMRRPEPAVLHWRDDVPVRRLPRGARLRVMGTEPFLLHWGHDGWQGAADLRAQPLALGLWGVEVPVPPGAATVEFTRAQEEVWEGRDHVVTLDGGGLLPDKAPATA